MKELRIVKLVSGDVVMGNMDENDLENIEFVMDKPMQLVLDPSRGGIGMMPYNALYSQIEPEEHTFKTIHVMEFIPVHSSFEDAYTNQMLAAVEPEVIEESIDSTDSEEK